MSAKKLVETKWAWMKQCGGLQDGVYPTADAAIKEMRERTNWHLTIEEVMQRTGVRLAMVKVTVEAIAVLDWTMKENKT